ncbi:MAG TPA: pyridoxal-phosphate dependent enzyme [Candidatus Acidoferrales bacterium]|nr:pyridoxal-phosphate dependent enzyme [Candidatus Acidoferrales bacterium]
MNSPRETGKPRYRFAEAREFLARYFKPTRMVEAPSLRKRAGQDVYLKLESELPTGSFKVRGALYALHANLQRGKLSEVVASSTGNHGAAVAYAAQVLGVKARIFLPEKNNPVKREKIAQLGAEIVEEGAIDLAAAYVAALEYARATGAFFLNDATDPDLPAGPGTIGLEIIDELPETAVIYVPMGDTALIRGVAAAAKQASKKVRIVGVQSRNAPSYFLSWKAGRAISTRTCDTIADGLATRTPVPANVGAIRELVDDVILVSEQDLLDAIAKLALEERVVAEPAGAAATAAFLKSGEQASPAVLLVTGANVERSVLQRAIGTEGER